MKKLIVIVLVIGLSLSGCIKSLHSIVGEGDRILDERIEGVWSQNHQKKMKEAMVEDSVVHDTGLLDKLTMISEFMITHGEKQFWEIYRAADFIYSYQNSDGSNVQHLFEGKYEHFEFPNDFQPSIGDSITNLKLEEKIVHDHYILKTRYDYSGRDAELRIAQLTKIGGDYYLDISEKPSDRVNELFAFLYPDISGHTIVKLGFEGKKILLYEFDADYIESLIKEKRIRLKHEMVNDEIILTASTEQLRTFLIKYGNDDKLFEEAEEFYTYQES